MSVERKPKKGERCWYCGEPAAKYGPMMWDGERMAICDDAGKCIQDMVAHGNVPWTHRKVRP